MEDAVDAVEVEHLVGEVELPDVEPPRVLLLLRAVIGAREAVDADDVVARLDERAGELRADEARRAGDEIPHRGTIP